LWGGFGLTNNADGVILLFSSLLVVDILAQERIISNTNKKEDAMEVKKGTEPKDIIQKILTIAVGQQGTFVVKGINYVVVRLTVEPPKFRLERQDKKYSLLGLQGPMSGPVRAISIALQDLALM
jgi:hypothetical protein